MIKLLLGVNSLCERVSVYSKDSSAVQLIEDKNITAKELMSKEILEVKGKVITVYFDTVKNEMLNDLY